MRQRVMIAMAVSCNPDILIADEPTTALDVTIQAQILVLLRKLRNDFGTAVVLITHDMGVVADLADRIAVMYAGRIVEQGTRREVFYDAQHPYTWACSARSPGWTGPSPGAWRRFPGSRPRCSGWPRGAPSPTAARTGSTCATSSRRCSTGSAAITWTPATSSPSGRRNCGRPPSTPN